MSHENDIVRYSTPLFLFSLVVFIDRLHEQALNLQDGKGFFSKGVKLGFGQNLCQRCDTFNGCATGDKVVRPLAPISLFVVGDTVFKRKRTIASTCSYASFSAIIVSHDTESKKLST